jgi:nicotinamidase-related amidase
LSSFSTKDLNHFLIHPASERSAYDHGYNVAFITDAMTDRDAETHRYCVEKVFPRFGERDTTENLLRLLDI